jgi:mRNA interferase HigB
VRIIALKTLKEFWECLPEANMRKQAQQALLSWHAEAKAADWKSSADIKAKYKNASILKDSRIVFNICGNKYRLIVRINYAFPVVYIRFIGTHKEYDKINAEAI